MRKQTKTLAMCGALLLVATLSSGTLLAADKEPLPALSDSIDVRVVNLEAVVTDKGIPIHNLTPADFRLRIDGKLQPIDYFSEIRGGVALAETPGDAGGIRAIPAVRPGNAVGTSYLVFIDSYFSLAQDRDQVLESLRNQLGNLRPEDRMAIVAYDGARLEMLSSWTNSTPALERAIRQAEQWPALGLQRWSEARSFEVSAQLPSNLRYRRGRVFPLGIRSQLTPDEYFYARLLEDQTERMVMAASATLRGFGAAPGRRVAILLSGGWPYDIPAYVTDSTARPVLDPGFAAPGEIYAPLVETANLLGYTLYPVDLPGLQGTVRGGAEFGFAAASLTPRSTSIEREQQVHQTLTYLARETGGEALINSSRSDLLNVAAGDTSSYYWIGFTPDRNGDDSRWKVVLETTRPDLKVRTRRSFTDLSRDRELGMAVESALLFGNPPSPQPLTASLSNGQMVGKRKMRATLSIQVPSDAVAMLAQGDHYVADLELRVAALDRNGGSSEGSSIPVRLSSASPSSARPMTYETELELRSNTEKLIISLYDKASGSMLMQSIGVAL